jgi:hypothetical protein
MARDLAKLWRIYAETGPGEDAPIYRDIANAVAGDEDLLAVVRAAPPETHHPNHLLAAVQFLLLGGAQHPLAECYEAGDSGCSVEEFRRFVREHRAEILDVLAVRRVQTNEIGRTGVILAGLAHIARRAKAPLGLVDVGCSAGLNLLVDKCRVSYGPLVTGPLDSTIQLNCDLLGAEPPLGSGDIDIEWRIGLDRHPVDLDDEASLRWLRACVWVEQHDRIERLLAAISLHREHRPEIVAGDAVRDLADALGRAPDHVHLVVLTSWVAFYLTVDERLEFEGVLGAAERPVSWLSLEHPGVVPDIAATTSRSTDSVAPSVIACVSYGHEPAREFLGWAHPHGRWLDWRPAAKGASG